MKIKDCVENMSKLYLNRVLNSFSRDIHKLSESGMREFILKNYSEITQKGHVAAKLNFSSHGHKQRILMQKLLKFFLLQPERTVEENDLFKLFQTHIKETNKIYKNKEIFNAIPERKKEVIATVFEVILEDERMSIDEERIIDGLKEKLDLTTVELYSILNSVKRVDKEFNFTNTEVDEAVKELQNKGILYYLGRNVPTRKYVIPDEISDVLIKRYNYPLTWKSFELLFSQLNKGAIQSLLKKRKLKVSRTKEEMINVLFKRGYDADKLLLELNKADLNEIVKELENVNTSSAKNKLVIDILRNYFYLNTAPLEKGRLDFESLWEYYDDFANRRYAKLRQLGLINKDLEIEHRFEELTHYALKKISGVKASIGRGSNREDGIARDSSGDLMFWDNKSQENAYNFPLKHQKQFIQYVVQAKEKPNIFLIITGCITNEKSINSSCIKLSAETGTTFAVVSADVFKNIVENCGRGLDLQVFNYSGVVNKQRAQLRSEALV